MQMWRPKSANLGSFLSLVAVYMLGPNVSLITNGFLDTGCDTTSIFTHAAERLGRIGDPTSVVFIYVHGISRKKTSSISFVIHSEHNGLLLSVWSAIQFSNSAHQESLYSWCRYWTWGEPPAERISDMDLWWIGVGFDENKCTWSALDCRTATWWTRATLRLFDSDEMWNFWVHAPFNFESDSSTIYHFKLASILEYWRCCNWNSVIGNVWVRNFL